MQGAKALAVLHGRDYVLPADVHELAVDALAHRPVLTCEAQADDVQPSDVVRRVLAAVEPPSVVPDRADTDEAA